MIESLSNYAFAIICSSFIMNLIQMILPDSSNRKYVIFVCGVIITIILINPVISIVHKDFDIQKILTINEEKYVDIEKNYEEQYNEEILGRYKKNVEEGIVKRLNDAGYVVHSIECEYDEKTLEPKALKLNIEADSGTVTPVRIEVSSEYNGENKKLSFVQVANLKSMLKSTYGINNIKINEWYVNSFMSCDKRRDRKEWKRIWRNC